MIQRDECLKVLAEFHSNEIVVPVYQVAFEWRIIKPHPLTYLFLPWTWSCLRQSGQADYRSGW